MMYVHPVRQLADGIFYLPQPDQDKSRLPSPFGKEKIRQRLTWGEVK